MHFKQIELTGFKSFADRTILNLEDGMTAVVSKEMVANPRRIAAAPIDITVAGKLTDEQKQKLEHAARHCPVAMSLHPDLDDTMRFHYPDDE